ncbi:MAG: hypothetical protein IPK07_21975 [Deltaproteobacteria bacterium]|nr:hypothetical protein [Deltaproteobacteria bacterium]
MTARRTRSRASEQRASLGALAVAAILAAGGAAGAQTPQPGGDASTPAVAGGGVEQSGAAEGGGFFAGNLFSSKGGPIEVRADSFVLKNQVRTLRYEGNVEAVQADTTLRCRALTLRYTEDNQIRDGLCEDDVKFTSADRVITAGVAELVRNRQTITLTKDVRIWQGENEIRGDQAKIFLDDQRIVVDGSPSRPVRTTVQSGGTSALDFGPPQLGATPSGGSKLRPPRAEGAGGGGEKLPLHVRALHFEGDRNRHFAVYQGSVVAERGDVTLACEDLTIRFDAQNREVDSAEARGGVQIVQGDRNVTADTGRFLRQSQRVVLEGRPAIARHDKDELRCQRIEYDQGSDELRCQGAGQHRVETNIKSKIGAGDQSPLGNLTGPRGR